MKIQSWLQSKFIPKQPNILENIWNKLLKIPKITVPLSFSHYQDFYQDLNSLEIVL